MSINTQTNVFKTTKIEIPARVTFQSRTEPISIVHRLYGPGTNKEVFTQIQQDELLIPTQGQHVSYALLARRNPEDRELGEITEVIKRYLHGGTDVHSFPGNIVFYHDITHLDQRLRNPNQKELESMLGSKESIGVVYSDDGRLRRVQGRYPTNELEFGTLGTHPQIIGITGSEEVAEEANELASLYRFKPRLWLLKDVNNPITSFSALYSVWVLDGSRLCVDGDSRGYYGGGYALGVQKKTGEASHA